MGGAVRDTWNNQRWVIDRLVDAVEAGDTDAKVKLGQRFTVGIGQNSWTDWTLIDVGQFLPLTFLDPDRIERDDLDWLAEDETIPDFRLDEILSGGLSGMELIRWRRRVADLAFFPEEDGRDMLWLVTKVKRAGGRVAYVAGFGYDLASLTFVAAYDTFAEVMNALKVQGFTSWKDYQARSAAVFATT